MAQTTFTVPASADDGFVFKEDNIYPPGWSAIVNTTSASIVVRRSYYGGVFNIYNGLLRWDTSSIPVGSTIISAQLRFFLTLLQYANSRSLRLEWYSSSNWPIDAGDYLENEAGDAGSFALSGLTSSAYNTLNLATVTGIVVAGWTGMRLHITGGQPTGWNYVYFASKDNVDGYDPPQLIVTYTPPAGGGVKFCGVVCSKFDGVAVTKYDGVA